MYLGVWSENARAIAFYRKCGFDVVGKYLPEEWAGFARDGGAAQPAERERLDCELVMRL